MGTFDPSEMFGGYVLVRADAEDRTGKTIKDGNRVMHTDGKIGTVLSAGNETVRVDWDDGYKQTVTNPKQVLMVLR